MDAKGDGDPSPRPISAGDALIRDMDQQRAKSAPGKNTFELGVSDREWVSEETELEVQALHVRNNRPLIGFFITQERRKFGRAYEFRDNETDKVPGFTRQPIPNYSLERRQLDMGFQAAAEQKDVSTQTEWRPKVNKVTQYSAIEFSEKERKTILDGEDMQEFLSNIVGKVSRMLQSNDTVDLFKDEFLEFKPQGQNDGDSRSEQNIKELHSFTDLVFSKNRIISAIAWHPARTGVVAFACANNLTFDQWVDVSGKVLSSSVLVWNFSDLLHPQLILDVPGDLYCMKINQNNPNYVIGGLMTGQVIFWDLSDARARLQPQRQQGSDKKDEKSEVAIPHIKPTMLSFIGRSHTRAVVDIDWMPLNLEINRKGDFVETKDAKFSSQFTTVAADGVLHFWDVRAKEAAQPRQYEAQQQQQQQQAGSGGAGGAGDAPVSLIKAEIKWLPVYSLPLQRPDPLKPAEWIPLTGCRFAFWEGKQLLTATEDGEMATLDLATREVVDERGRWGTVKRVIPAHLQSCASIHRSPFFPNMFLTVGDWSFCIWRTDLDHPIFQSAPAVDYLTSGRWSPTRPGVIITGRADGSVDVWDLVDQCHRPSLSYSLGGVDKITSMEFWQGKSKTQSTAATGPAPLGPQYLAVGDASGKLHVLEMPQSLKQGPSAEVSMIEAFFERELNRARYVAKRMQIRAEEKKKIDEKKQLAMMEKQNQQQPQTAEEKEKELAAAVAALSATQKELEQKAAAEEAKAEQEYQQLLQEYFQVLVEGKGQITEKKEKEAAKDARGFGLGLR